MWGRGSDYVSDMENNLATERRKGVNQLGMKDRLLHSVSDVNACVQVGRPNSQCLSRALESYSRDRHRFSDMAEKDKSIVNEIT